MVWKHNESLVSRGQGVKDFSRIKGSRGLVGVGWAIRQREEVRSEQRRDRDEGKEWFIDAGPKGNFASLFGAILYTTSLGEDLCFTRETR